MTTAELIEWLRALKASGPDSFESLIASCLQELTGREFSLQRSGSQHGRDLTTDRSRPTRVFVECKRYGADRELDERELLGEAAQAVRDPDLDVWVLVTSRAVDDNRRDALRDHLSQFGVDFIAVSLADGMPSSLEVLLASSAHSVRRFVATDTAVREIESCLQDVRGMVGFEAGKDRLRALVEREAVGLEAWKARPRDSLHEDLHDPLRSRARFRQRIEFGSGFVDRPSLFIRLDEWRRTWRTTPAPIVLVGDEGDGKTWLACSWVDQRACADSSFPAVLVVNSAALDDKPLMDVIVDAATTQPTALPEYGQPTRDRVRRRVARWTSAARTTPADQPPILLLLDGLDEGASPRTLRALIDRSRVDLPRVPLLMTVRAKFWDEHFRPDRDLSVHELTVGPLMTTSSRGPW